MWEHFAELTRIARPPKRRRRPGSTSSPGRRERDFDTNVDAEGNVLVRVPAQAGRESAQTVVLQAHLDMVCERDPSSPYDPREGRINVVVDGDWVLAEGTTLGADNGIGVAGAMAVADDPEIAHGPLELLFTVSEEQGLDGAKALDPALVSGRILLNLDGTSDRPSRSAARGAPHVRRAAARARALPAATMTRSTSCCPARHGGHSGGDIAIGRVNAIKALGRVLARSVEQEPFRLAASGRSEPKRDPARSPRGGDARAGRRTCVSRSSGAGARCAPGAVLRLRRRARAHARTCRRGRRGRERRGPRLARSTSSRRYRPASSR